MASDPRYEPYLKLSWWTVTHAANIICGIFPAKKLTGEEMDIGSGGPRALLYFELKNLAVEEYGALISGDSRIRPALALRVAKRLGIEPPRELMNLLVENPEGEPKPLSQKKEETLYRIIGALLAVINGKLPGTNRHSEVESQTALVGMIEKKAGLRGLGARSLETHFATANTEFESSV